MLNEVAFGKRIGPEAISAASGPTELGIGGGSVVPAVPQAS